jgi:hypothetical protein
MKKDERGETREESQRRQKRREGDGAAGLALVSPL